MIVVDVGVAGLLESRAAAVARAFESVPEELPVGRADVVPAKSVGEVGPVSVLGAVSTGLLATGLAVLGVVAAPGLSQGRAVLEGPLTAQCLPPGHHLGARAVLDPVGADAVLVRKVVGAVSCPGALGVAGTPSAGACAGCGHRVAPRCAGRTVPAPTPSPPYPRRRRAPMGLRPHRPGSRLAGGPRSSVCHGHVWRPGRWVEEPQGRSDDGAPSQARGQPHSGCHFPTGVPAVATPPPYPRGGGHGHRTTARARWPAEKLALRWWSVTNRTGGGALNPSAKGPQGAQCGATRCRRCAVAPPRVVVSHGRQAPTRTISRTSVTPLDRSRRPSRFSELRPAAQAALADLSRPAGPAAATGVADGTGRTGRTHGARLESRRGHALVVRLAGRWSRHDRGLTGQ